jgi:hypothetical protein
MLPQSLAHAAAAAAQGGPRMRNRRRIYVFAAACGALTWLGFTDPRLAAMGGLALALLLFAWAVHSLLK